MLEQAGDVLPPAREQGRCAVRPKPGRRAPPPSSPSAGDQRGGPLLDRHHPGKVPGAQQEALPLHEFLEGVEQAPGGLDRAFHRDIATSEDCCWSISAQALRISPSRRSTSRMGSTSLAQVGLEQAAVVVVVEAVERRGELAAGLEVQSALQLGDDAPGLGQLPVDDLEAAAGPWPAGRRPPGRSPSRSAPRRRAGAPAVPGSRSGSNSRGRRARSLGRPWGEA